MFPIEITIPNYIREVKVSDAQRPIYYEWDGRTIRARGKELLKRYIDKNHHYEIVHPENLREGYHIGIVLDNIVIGHIFKDIQIINPFLIKEAIITGKTGITVTKKQADRLKFYLVEGERIVIANEAKVGTPRIIRIKGQDIYSGNAREHTRAAIMHGIKDSFKPYLQGIPTVVDFPIGIETEVHTTIKLAHDRAKDGMGVRWDLDNHIFPYNKAFADMLTEEGIIPDDDRLHVTIPPHAIFCPIERDEDRKLVFRIFKDDRQIINNNVHYARERVT